VKIPFVVAAQSGDVVSKGVTDGRGSFIRSWCSKNGVKSW
jgi:hypothetical protein